MPLKVILALSTTATCFAVHANTGCDIDESSPLFTTQPSHNQAPPAHWNNTLTNFHHIQGSAAQLSTYTILPDGKLSFIPSIDTNGSTNWDLYFGNYTNEKVNHHTLDLETFNSGDIRNVLELRYHFNPDITADSWHSGGGWLMSVHDVGGDKRVGYLHGEDWYYDVPNHIVDATSHKSVGYTCSNDGGETWSDPIVVLQSVERPVTPDWTGVGDGHFVWDFQNERWVAFFQNKTSANGGTKISAAATTDKSLATGWKKWDGHSFSISAMPTAGQAKYGQAVHEEAIGANPAVSWNTYLNKWVMVYGSWEGDILISYADYLPHFSTPQILISKEDVDGLKVFKARYPTLVSPETGSEVTGKENKLYFRIDIDGDMYNMQFMSVDLNFEETSAPPSNGGGSSSGGGTSWFTLLLLGFLIRKKMRA